MCLLPKTQGSFGVRSQEGCIEFRGRMDTPTPTCRQGSSIPWLLWPVMNIGSQACIRSRSFICWHKGAYQASLFILSKTITYFL